MQGDEVIYEMKVQRETDGTRGQIGGRLLFPPVNTQDTHSVHGLSYTQNPTTWVISSSYRKMASSLNSRCSPPQQTAAEISMSWMVTQLYSVVASRPTLGPRAAHLSVARPQQKSAGAGLGLETKRSALGAHLSVDTYS